MHVSSYSCIGKHKAINQDYVQHYDNNTVIVCDGCSGAKHTDIGARIINHYYGSAKFRCESPEQIVFNLGLPNETLYCTLLKLCTDGDNLAFYRVGDGYLAVCFEDRLEISRFNYKRSAPYYVGYLLLGEDEKFLAIQGNDLSIERWTFSAAMELLSKEICLPLDERAKLDEVTTYDLADIKWACVASDGLGSFIDEAGNLADEVMVLKKLFSFKNFQGDFIARRFIHGIKELRDDGYTNFDDLSVGGICL